jgi:hypothetical protein
MHRSGLDSCRSAEGLASNQLLTPRLFGKWPALASPNLGAWLKSRLSVPLPYTRLQSVQFPRPFGLRPNVVALQRVDRIEVGSPGRTRTCSLSVNSCCSQKSKCRIWCRLRKIQSHSHLFSCTQSRTQTLLRPPSMILTVSNRKYLILRLSYGDRSRERFMNCIPSLAIPTATRQRFALSCLERTWRLLQVQPALMWSLHISIRGFGEIFNAAVGTGMHEQREHIGCKSPKSRPDVVHLARRPYHRRCTQLE